MDIDTSKTINSQKLYKLPQQPVKGFAELCRKAAADGAVLLKNDNHALPFADGEKISVFGRIQNTYYKSGTGSGGLVNAEYVTDIVTSLEKSGKVQINQELRKIYADFIAEHPFKFSTAWAQEPWNQLEMPINNEIINQACHFSSTALVIIGRTAGEDHDNCPEQGSYFLTDTEKDMLKKVSAAFDKVCVVINAGNIIDSSFLDDCKIDSLLYVWHGGQEGGNAAADILTGKVSPSGRLSDTIVYNISDHYSDKNFGASTENKYVEDIYVGYRYFETFAKQSVRFPFGYGLSYTSFETEFTSVCDKTGKIIVTANVTNTGNCSGRHVVQIYYSAPQGVLGKPSKELAVFAKTSLLAPGKSESVTIEFDIDSMASYDDGGATGNKSCYVLEAGEYIIFGGDNVRDCKQIYSMNIPELVVTQQLSEALAPVKQFERIKPKAEKDGYTIEFEAVPQRTIDLYKRIADNRPADIEYTGDKGYKLLDVADGKISMDKFVAQLSDYDLACMARGEGMSSPKVTAGTGCAFGGVTDNLLDFGIPVDCGTDGPSGIRLDSGSKATSLPIGTLLACTWDTQLVEELYTYEGMELFAYNIDMLLGPGMNIHRHPLNGRNFEYFSEDPYLTGVMGAAISKGIAKSGTTSVIKHFIANNQEHSRNYVDAVISERAIREIYLRGFEIAVKDGGATAIMTTYNPTNGFWNASNYDLNTTILRGEWGFDGFVMTDWWAMSNIEGEGGDMSNLKAMVRAQNDVFMVCKSSADNNDNIMQGLNEGFITRGELQRNAKNVLRYILKSPTFAKYVLGGCNRPVFDTIDDSKMQTVLCAENVQADDKYEFVIDEKQDIVICATMYSSLSSLAQSSVFVYIDGKNAAYFSINGLSESLQKKCVTCEEGTHCVTVKFDDPTEIRKIEIKK